jgi:ABC-type multidrug transport system fused ATPase/permease subunit
VALAFLALYLLMGGGIPLLSRLLSRGPGGRLGAARAELNATLVDGIQGVADLVAFGQEAAQVARVRATSADLIAAQTRLAGVSALTAALGVLLSGLGVLVVLGLAIPSVSAGRIAGVNLAVLALAAAASFEAVLPLPLAAQYWESCVAAAGRILGIGDWKLEAGSWKLGAGNEERDLRLSPFNLQSSIPNPQSPIPEITIENLSFRYVPDEPPALADVTFTVPAGGRVTVMGPSGAGKTTLVNLLARFWDYDEGSIRLGGRELRDIPPETVRDMIGVVTQSTYLFNASVRDNLWLARPEATQAEIEAAARQTQIHDFIISLPQGYDTWIGEQGLRLSGGERQRLAIARALLRNSPILILDEPTANLDALTEAAVLDTLEKLMIGRTTLIISHNLIGLEKADKIVVLRAGRVVETGRHAELLAKNGVYRRLWRARRGFCSSSVPML